MGGHHRGGGDVVHDETTYYGTRQPDYRSRNFCTKFDSNQIATATIVVNQQSLPLTEINGFYYRAEKDGKLTKDEIPFVVHNAWLTPEMMNALTHSPKIAISAPNVVVMNLLWGIAPFLIFGVLFWFFFIRQIKAAGKGALSFGKSKARMLAKDRNKTTFKDVAGRGRGD